MAMRRRIVALGMGLLTAVAAAQVATLASEHNMKAGAEFLAENKKKEW